MATLDSAYHVKNVQSADLSSSNQVFMVWDVKLLSSSDTLTVPGLEDLGSVSSISNGINVSAASLSGGNTVLTISGGSVGQRVLIATAHRKNLINATTRDSDTVTETQSSGRSLRSNQSDANSRLTTSNDGIHDWRRLWTVPNASTGEVSVSMWAKIEEPAPDSEYFTFFSIGRGHSVAAEDGMTLYALATRALHFELVVNSTTGAATKAWGLSSGNIPAIGEWFMFTATWDGTNGSDCIKLYINDALETSPVKTDDDDVTAISQPLGGALYGADPGAIGTTAANLHRAQGLIYSVATWDKVLSLSEIRAMYNNRRPDILDLTADSGGYTASSNLQDWWQPGKEDSNDIAAGVAEPDPYLSGPGRNFAGGTRDDTDEGNMENEDPADQGILAFQISEVPF